MSTFVSCICSFAVPKWSMKWKSFHTMFSAILQFISSEKFFDSRAFRCAYILACFLFVSLFSLYLVNKFQILVTHHALWISHVHLFGFRCGASFDGLLIFLYSCGLFKLNWNLCRGDKIGVDNFWCNCKFLVTYWCIGCELQILLKKIVFSHYEFSFFRDWIFFWARYFLHLLLLLFLLFASFFDKPITFGVCLVPHRIGIGGQSQF